MKSLTPQFFRLYKSALQNHLNRKTLPQLKVI